MKVRRIGTTNTESDLLDLRGASTLTLVLHAGERAPSRLEFHQQGEGWGSMSQFRDYDGNAIAVDVTVDQDGNPQTLTLPDAVKCDRVSIVADQACHALVT